MCELRAANPMRIQPTRSGRDGTFAAVSPYRRAEPATGDLATRVTSYVVLTLDPAVPDVAADYWMHSERFYRAVADPIGARLGGDLAYRRLVAHPTDVEAERALAARVADLFAEDPALAEELAARADVADDNVYINYFRGPDYALGARTADVERLTSLAAGTPVRPDGRGDEVLVVVPISDRDGAGRIRNLMACLLALRDQTMPASDYRVTVVEFDEKPRWRDRIEPLADHYLHVTGHGLFNKSWTVNAGVRHTLGAARTLCLLDADILVDRDFLRRNHARFAEHGHDAHLPHTEMLSLDAQSSDRLIEDRCGGRRPEVPLAGARGLLLRDVPGACLWLTPELFAEVGGLDERYRGWGGEDEDMLYRVATAGTAVQFDDVFVHLAHRRPAMRREDGAPFNAHVPVGTWNGAQGYGDLERVTGTDD
ncbi:galactosyltransferase-related protein [Amycolatopsis eburnea]|uniref:Glycosyltransferase n=1 Tax=Amycolatopsis eburnea TaxID=2267691 RepID=A0A3R9KK44_9PSEU|nr:galactosyltransferase-related protein [Amycolatopsis eburnea]RSD16415.1 glycosyltransferase [Amycolatopsis eburnea]